ncbi:MAG: hypothetical protein H6736_04790 [Alphaproteobacteria bacterium]|nr:hypothetical protein [Alphaproteobacteria bacterium]MCB9691114.1 hypothetical protein [Alphaproteobacteria bacterium]
MWMLLFACRPSAPVTPPPTPTAVTPPMPTGDTGGPDACPFAPQRECLWNVFPVEGRVEWRALNDNVDIAVCVANASTTAGCNRLFGNCPESVDSALAREDLYCRLLDDFLVGGRLLTRVACSVPEVGDLGSPEDYQYHSIWLLFDEGHLVAVTDYFMPPPGGSEYPCCSDGGVSRWILWAEIDFLECAF